VIDIFCLGCKSSWVQIPPARPNPFIDLQPEQRFQALVWSPNEDTSPLLFLDPEYFGLWCPPLAVRKLRSNWKRQRRT
jgi:hypothetical protein